MGMKKNIQFQCTDPWLLLAIIYACQQGGSSLSDILGYGDFINHAIFSLEELQSGLHRLIKSGYVIKEKDKFLPTDKIIIPYHKFSKHKNSVSRDLQFIRTELNAPEWSSNYDPTKANKSGGFKEINKDTYKMAYKEYAQKVKTDV